MAPEVQPCVCIAEFNFAVCEPLRDVPRQANEAVAVRGIDRAVRTALAGAFKHPVAYAVLEFLGGGVKCLGDVPERLQLVEYPQRIAATTDAENALDANNAA